MKPWTLAFFTFLTLFTFVPFSAAARNPDTLVIAHVSEPVSLDPVVPYDAVSHGLLYNVYETLIAFDGPALDRFVPVLAVEVPSVANGGIAIDGKTYRFKIRKGVTFHGGKEMTASDVRWSLLRFMLTDPAGGPASLLLEPVLGVGSTRGPDGQLQVKLEDAEKAVQADGDVVTVRLARPFAPFLAIMARWSYVMDREWTASAGGWGGQAADWAKFNDPPREGTALFERANGTGPYRLERWDRRGKAVYLRRHDKYWRKPAAVERALFKTVDEFATRKLMLQAGDADFVDVPRPFLPQVLGMEGVTVDDSLPRLSTDPAFYFTFQVSTTANPDIGSGRLDGEGIPPDFFSDPDVRKGFAHAFDYDTFLRDSYKGKARRASGPIPPAIPGWDPKAPKASYDPKKAEAHFRKAWGGKVWEKGFQFTLSYNTGGEIRELACAVMRKGVEALNPRFHIRVRGLDWPSYLDKTQARKMPLFTRGWIADYPDAHNFVFPFYHSQGRYPIAQAFKDAELDRLIEAAVAAPDLEARKALYAQVQARGFELMPQVVTVHADGSSVRRSWVKGFVDNPVFMGTWLYPLSK